MFVIVRAPIRDFDTTNIIKMFVIVRAPIRDSATTTFDDDELFE